MTDASSTYGDGSIPADADFAPDIADDDEVASLFPGGSPVSGDATADSREDIEPEEGVATP